MFIVLALAASPVAFVLLVVVLAGTAAARRPGLRLGAVAVPAFAVVVATAAELITLHLFPVGTLAFPAEEAVQAVAFCVGLLALTWRLEPARRLRGVLAVYLVTPSRSTRSRRGSATTSRAYASSPYRSRWSSQRCGVGDRCRSCWRLSHSPPPGTSSPRE